MILIDANLLLYAHVAAYPEHQRARKWFLEQLNGPAQVGLPWISILAFVRLIGNPRIYSRAVPTADAWRQVREWLSCASAWIPQPTTRHADVLGELLEMPGMRFDLTTDAHLAALAIEHGLTLCSNDRDFARFPKLRWINPLG